MLNDFRKTRHQRAEELGYMSCLDLLIGNIDRLLYPTFANYSHENPTKCLSKPNSNLGNIMFLTNRNCIGPATAIDNGNMAPVGESLTNPEASQKFFDAFVYCMNNPEFVSEYTLWGIADGFCKIISSLGTSNKSSFLSPNISEDSLKVLRNSFGFSSSKPPPIAKKLVSLHLGFESTDDFKKSLIVGFLKGRERLLESETSEETALFSKLKNPSIIKNLNNRLFFNIIHERIIQFRKSKAS